MCLTISPQMSRVPDDRNASPYLSDCSVCKREDDGVSFMKCTVAVRNVCATHGLDEETAIAHVAVRSVVRVFLELPVLQRQTCQFFCCVLSCSGCFEWYPSAAHGEFVLPLLGVECVEVVFEDERLPRGRRHQSQDQEKHREPCDFRILSLN